MTLRLYDNTRLSAFKQCPRRYMFRHEFHWVSEGTAIALVYGGAWHAAMEVIWADIKVEDHRALAQRAYSAFVEHWVHGGMPPPNEIDYEMEKELSPRTPGRAFEMIVAYIDKRSQTADDFEVIAIEKPFVVPLDPVDPTLFYIGKIDKIVKRFGTKILGIEHKTTSLYKKGASPFRSNFLDSFSPNAQVDGYLYALHMMFPGSVGGVWVDAALVHKQEFGFTYIPVEKQLDHLDSWLSDTKWWITRLERERDVLRNTLPEDKYLRAFPKNTNACIDFATTCPYLDLCKAWPNPVGRNLPPGFRVDPWNPLDHIKGLEELREKDGTEQDSLGNASLEGSKLGGA